MSLKDFQAYLESMGATRRHLGVTEMVLCARAKIFFGIALSIFYNGHPADSREHLQFSE